MNHTELSFSTMIEHAALMLGCLKICYLVGVLALEPLDEDLAEDRAFEKSPSENLLLSFFASESLESDLGLLVPSCGEDSTFFFAPNDSTVFSKFLL